jgi:hypothetical protein
MGVSGETVHPGHFTAREKAGFEGWVGTGYFGEKIVLLLLSRFEPQIFQHISWLFC